VFRAVDFGRDGRRPVLKNYFFFYCRKKSNLIKHSSLNFKELEKL